MGEVFSLEQISRQLTDWYQHPSRQVFIDQTQRLTHEWLADSFGYYALEISSFKHGSSWFENNVRSCFQIGTSRPSMVSAWSSLPIDAESIDLVVMNHVLEFADRPRHLLREVDRILIPEGKLLLVLFNPLGPSGLARPFRRHRGAPWCGQFYSSRRIKQWLMLSGFDIVHFNHAVAPFASCDRLTQISHLMEKYLPWSCGLYLVYAVKRVSSVHLIGSAWKDKAVRDRGLEPTAFSADKTD